MIRFIMFVYFYSYNTILLHLQHFLLLLYSHSFENFLYSHFSKMFTPLQFSYLMRNDFLNFLYIFPSFLIIIFSLLILSYLFIIFSLLIPLYILLFFVTDNVSILKIILWITLEFYVIFQNYLYLTVKNESKSKKHEKKPIAKWW